MQAENTQHWPQSHAERFRYPAISPLYDVPGSPLDVSLNFARELAAEGRCNATIEDVALILSEAIRIWRIPLDNEAAQRELMRAFGRYLSEHRWKFLKYKGGPREKTVQGFRVLAYLVTFRHAYDLADPENRRKGYRQYFSRKADDESWLTELAEEIKAEEDMRIAANKGASRKLGPFERKAWRWLMVNGDQPQKVWSRKKSEHAEILYLTDAFNRTYRNVSKSKARKPVQAAAQSRQNEPIAANVQSPDISGDPEPVERDTRRTYTTNKGITLARTGFEDSGD